MKRFYRIVETDPPTDWDFFSFAQRGVEPRRRTKYTREFDDGVSVYDDLDAAVDVARANEFAWGRYIVALDVPEDDRIEVKSTFQHPNHYTIYQSDYLTPDLIRSFVVGPAHYVT